MSIDLERESDYGELLAREVGHPGENGVIPAEISILSTPRAVNSEQLTNMADDFLRDRPHITNAIIRYGKDAVALATKRGVMLYIGVGVASLAAITGGVVIWQKLHKKDSSSK